MGILTGYWSNNDSPKPNHQTKSQGVEDRPALLRTTSRDSAYSDEFVDMFKAGDKTTPNETEQQDYLRELDEVLAEGDSTPVTSDFDEQSLDEQDLEQHEFVTSPVADASTRIGPNPALAQPHTHELSVSEDELTPEPTEHDFFKSLLDWDMLNELSPSPRPSSPATSQQLEVQVDFSDSPHLPLYVLPPVKQDTQQRRNGIRSHISPNYEKVTDYRNGKALPKEYLTHIRGKVDTTLSNDNWGDQFYFANSLQFKYIEDFRPDPHTQSDNHALLLGLKLSAAKIPERSPDDGWESFDRVIGKLGRDGGKQEFQQQEIQHLPLTFVEMSRRIHAEAKETVTLNDTIPSDPRPQIQQQKTMHSVKSTHGVDKKLVASARRVPHVSHGRCSLCRENVEDQMSFKRAVDQDFRLQQRRRLKEARTSRDRESRSQTAESC